MEIKYLQNEKNEANIEFDNPTIIELMRVYLIKDSAVIFAAWKREHPTKNPILKVKTKGKTVKKAISDAISAIEKDTDKIIDSTKKSK